MRLIDANEAKKQISQMQTLKASERNLFRLALDRTPTYEPPNDPLTLAELQEMDGEPVWIKADKWHIKGKWGLVSVWAGPTGGKLTVYVFETKTGPTLYPNQAYGRCWLAYRRKPEEEII